MINLRCDNCDKVIEVTTITPFMSLHPDARLRDALPYCIEVRCPECNGILGQVWAMVRTHYGWDFAPIPEGLQMPDVEIVERKEQCQE